MLRPGKVPLEKSFYYHYPDLRKYWSSDNKLTAKDYSKHSGQKVKWICSKCNNTYESRIHDKIRNGQTKCYDCTRKQSYITRSKPIPGQSLLDKYSDICKEWSNKNKLGPESYRYGSTEKVFWKCRKCKHEWKASPNTRTNEKQQRGCPNCNFSHGEKAIEKFLIKDNIKYISQYRIKECRNKKPLPFDFAILDKNNKLLSLIEYNGQQHYIKKGKFVHSFDKRIENDNIKQNYCKENHIPLLIIKYTEFKNIEIILENWLKAL